MTIRTLLAELSVIALGSMAAGLFWNLLPKSQNGAVLAILIFLAVVVIHFFYDDKPKGKMRQDVPLIIMSFVVEMIVMMGSAFSCGLVLFPLALTAKLFNLQLPEFSDLTLAVWVLLNLYLGWTQVVMKAPNPSASDHSKQSL